MPAPQNHVLWCVNRSNAGGHICLYHDTSNLACDTAPLETLAWKVAGVNPGVTARFAWPAQFHLAWTNPGVVRTCGALSLQDSVCAQFSRNRFGYFFSGTAPGSNEDRDTAGKHFLAETDGSIPPYNSACLGLGMDGTCALAIHPAPNRKWTLTPAPVAAQAYWLTFGFVGEEGDIISPSCINKPHKIVFPPGAQEMTAVYQIDGTWISREGPPGLVLHQQ